MINFEISHLPLRNKLNLSNRSDTNVSYLGALVQIRRCKYKMRAWLKHALNMFQ